MKQKTREKITNIAVPVALLASGGGACFAGMFHAPVIAGIGLIVALIAFFIGARYGD